MVAEIPARSTPATASASDGPQTDKGTPESAQRLEEASTSTAAKIKTPPSTSGGEEAQQRQKDIADSVDTADSQAPAASSDLCSVCFGCALTIHDRYLYKVLDQCYHEKCLCCSVCREQFSASTCFTRNGLLFCREHFLSAFGPKCSRCAAPIGERSIVRRANQHIYHLECFQCVVCKRELNTGDQFYLIPMDGRLVCRQDFENATKEGSEMDCGNKRPRTTISAKSLETLKQAYQTSSKPARHVREQLAAQTGLDMRVVQVWFQNRRAKEKRLKKDAGRRWAAQQAANGHSADGGAATGGNSSNGSGGSGPASVSTAAGVGVHFGRGATLDSDSGASNGGESAESPFYAYTNPETSSDVDVHSMSDFYDPNGFLQGPPPDGANPMGSGIPAAPSGTPGSLQQLSAMMPPLMEMEQQQNMSPQQQRTPPSGRHQQQQLVMLEQLNAGNGPAMERQRATPMGSGGMGMGSAPGTPQQQQQMGPNTLFALQGSGVPPMLNGHCQANGLLSDQQQQYLLAAAAAGFAPPPPQMAPPPMGQFMPPAGLLASMPPGCPDVMSQMGPAPFYQPHPQHHMSQFQMMGHYAPNSQQQPIQQ